MFLGFCWLPPCFGPCLHSLPYSYTLDILWVRLKRTWNSSALYPKWLWLEVTKSRNGKQLTWKLLHLCHSQGWWKGQRSSLCARFSDSMGFLDSLGVVACDNIRSYQWRPWCRQPHRWPRVVVVQWYPVALSTQSKVTSYHYCDSGEAVCSWKLHLLLWKIEVKSLPQGF